MSWRRGPRLPLAALLAAASLAAALPEQPLGGACLAGPGAACPEELLEGDEEALALSGRTELLQHGVQLRTHRGPPAAGGADAPGGAGGAGGVDCLAHPMFCDAKLRCAQEPLTDAERAQLSTRLASPEGHANLRSWCAAYPMYATSVQRCIVEEDPQGYARSMYESQKELRLLDADAAYCFAAGHCNSTAITENASLLEAEGICDEHFGREAWTSVGWSQMERVMKVALAFERGEVSLGAAAWADKLAMIRNLSAVSAMTACAMGNFACDAAYCKTNYCDDGLYRSRFGALAWAS